MLIQYDSFAGVAFKNAVSRGEHLRGFDLALRYGAEIEQDFVRLYQNTDTACSHLRSSISEARGAEKNEEWRGDISEMQDRLRQMEDKKEQLRRAMYELSGILSDLQSARRRAEEDSRAVAYQMARAGEHMQAYLQVKFK